MSVWALWLFRISRAFKWEGLGLGEDLGKDTIELEVKSLVACALVSRSVSNSDVERPVDSGGEAPQGGIGFRVWTDLFKSKLPEVREAIRAL